METVKHDIVAQLQEFGIDKADIDDTIVPQEPDKFNELHVGVLIFETQVRITVNVSDIGEKDPEYLVTDIIGAFDCDWEVNVPIPANQMGAIKDLISEQLTEARDRNWNSYYSQKI